MGSYEKIQEEWGLRLMQPIFEMHDAGIPYEHILKLVGEAKRQVDLMAYVENWMKAYNPEGVELVH